MPAFVTNKLCRSRLDTIEAAGRLCQLLGLPRSTGQIYGLLYLTPEHLTLDEIASLLGISKASASTGTRQLIAWQAIRQVWVQGDRRDHFEAVPDLGDLVRSIYHAFFRPKFDRTKGRIDSLIDQLEVDHRNGDLEERDYQFCRERLQNLDGIHRKVQRVLPLAEKLI